MCFYSNVADGWQKTFPGRYPWAEPYVNPPGASGTITFPPPAATKKDIDDLRAEIEALKNLLTAAKEFDITTGQPDCESEEKVALIRRIAELVGVDLEDVLP